MSLKGFPSTEKLARTGAEHACITPMGYKQAGLNVMVQYVAQVGVDDAAEALSTNAVIVATGHVARKGDVIRITSGANIQIDVACVDTDANSITLGADLPADMGVGDTFQILRGITPTTSASGSVGASGPILFDRDGSNQAVTEDTATPANNRPLPVKITGLDGDVNINASNLNLEVQLSDQGADADSIRIGDGTNRAAFNADGSVIIGNGSQAFDSVSVNAAPLFIPNLSAALPAVSFSMGWDGSSHLEMAVDSSGKVKTLPDLSTNTGFADAKTIRNIPALDADHLLNIRHEAANTPLSVRNSNGTGFADYNGGPYSANTQRNVPAFDAEHLLALRHEAAITPLSTRPSSGTGFADYNAGPLGANTPRNIPAFDAEHLLAARHEAVTTPLSVKISDGVDFITTVAIPAAFQYVVGSFSKVFTTASIMMGWDGGAHKEIALDSTGRVKIANAGTTNTSALIYNDNSSANILTTGYTQLIASTGNDISRMHIFDSSGQGFIIAVGGAGSEVDKLYVPPGGLDNPYDIFISDGNRISAKAITGNMSVGDMIITALS